MRVHERNCVVKTMKKNRNVSSFKEGTMHLPSFGMRFKQIYQLKRTVNFRKTLIEQRVAHVHILGPVFVRTIAQVLVVVINMPQDTAIAVERLGCIPSHMTRASEAAQSRFTNALASHPEIRRDRGKSQHSKIPLNKVSFLSFSVFMIFVFLCHKDCFLQNNMLQRRKFRRGELDQGFTQASATNARFWRI